MSRIPQNALFPKILLAAILSLPGCESTQTGETLPNGEEAFAERCSILVHQISEEYEPVDYSDRGKYSFPKAIARMNKYGMEDPESAGYIQEYADGKYGFFHFPFVGIARILALYPDAPAVRENRAAFLERILLHDPEYHYNAVTGEGTENHVSMSRTSGYLFAEMAMGEDELDGVAQEWQSRLKEWILDWSKRVYTYGTGEWDSNPYTAYNLVGWLNLYDFAEDPEVRLAARAVLDYYAANIALKYTQGLLGGPESRGSGQYGPLSRSATEYLAWLWFGPTSLAENEDFFSGNEFIQSIHAATSGYRPPQPLRKLAMKELPKPAVYHNSKPNYQLTEKAESHEVFRIDKTFTMGTAQTPYGGWTNASYGLINWKLIIEKENGLPAVIIGNGGMKSLNNPRGRNPFDQFLQYGRVIVQMTRVPENAEQIEADVAAVFNEWRAASEEDFEQRWGRPHQFTGTHMEDSGKGQLTNANKSIIHLPEELDYALLNNWAFTKYADTYLAFRTLSGQPPDLKPGRLIDEAPRDHVSGFIMEVANADEHASYEAFIKAVAANNLAFAESRGPLEFVYQSLDGDSLDFRYSTSGSWKEMIFDWGSGVVEQQVGFNTPDWKQPEWPSGEGHGRIPELIVNGNEVTWPDPAAVLDGPLLRLADHILLIGDGAYTVDYSGTLPVFKAKSD